TGVGGSNRSGLTRRRRWPAHPGPFAAGRDILPTGGEAMSVWIWLLGAVLLLIAWEADPSGATRLILAGLAALGGWLVLRGGLRLRRVRRQPALALSSEQLQVGQSFTLRVGPPADGPAGGQAVAARLICRESATVRPRGGRRSATDVQDWIVQ